MELENEILFQRYGIVGYASYDGGVCDGTSSTGADDNTGTDDSKGLDSGASGHRGA